MRSTKIRNTLFSDFSISAARPSIQAKTASNLHGHCTRSSNSQLSRREAPADCRTTSDFMALAIQNLIQISKNVTSTQLARSSDAIHLGIADPRSTIAIG